MNDGMKVRGRDYIGVGVGAVIVNDRREVLLLLRKNSPEAGTWTIPGGAVEWFETCKAAIERECLEEVGLHISVERVLTIVDHISKAEGRHWVSVEYLCRVLGGTAMNRDHSEHAEMKWHPIDSLPSQLSQPTREALDRFVEQCAT